MNTQGNCFYNLRCPQTWGFDAFPEINDLMELKVESCNITKSDDAFFRDHIILSFEKYRRGEYDIALQVLEECNDVCAGKIEVKCKKCYNHVLEACKAFCLLQHGLKEDAENICQKLVREEYSDEDEANFLYLQCKFSMQYGEKGSGECVNLMKRALELVEDDADFHNFLGILMTKIRHFKFPYPKPTEEEIHHLRKAVNLRKDCPWYACDLARAYLDLSHSMPHSEKIKIQSTVTDIYRKAIQHDTLRPSMVARCLNHLTKFDFSPELEKYAKLAKQKSNSVLVNHYVGLFYLRNNQFVEALSCFDVASDFLPFLISLRLLLKYKLNNSSVDDITLEKWIREKRDKFNGEKLMTFHLCVSEFFLLVLEDFRRAASAFSDYLSLDPKFKSKDIVKISKKFKNVKIVHLMMNQLLNYEGSNEDIINVKLKVTEFMRTRKMFLHACPPLESIINTLY